MDTVHHLKFTKSIQLGFSIFVAIAGMLYITPKVVTSSDAFDLHIIWVAGKLWASGQNPYGEAFSSEYAASFGPVPEMHQLVYPPYWFPIAVPLSFLSFETACLVWRLINFGLLVWATFLTSRIMAEKNPPRFWTIFLFGLGYVTLMQPTARVFSFGQTTLLLYFALAAIFYGLSKKHQWLLASGLFVVALKPNIGVVAYLVVAMMPEWRRTLAFATFALILAAVPVLLLHAPSDTLSGLLIQLRRYYAIYANRPPNMVGLFHFLDALPSALTANVLIGAATVVSLAAFRLKSPEVLKFARVTMAILLLVPLHSYDMVMLAIPAIFNWSQGTLALRTLLAFAGLLICLRPQDIAHALNIAPGLPFAESGPATLGMLLVALPFFTPAMLAKKTDDFSQSPFMK